MEINVLKVLDEMDKFRRKHQNDIPSCPDWCMRCMEAILAEAAGHKDRNDWTEALKANPDTEYHKDFA